MAPRLPVITKAIARNLNKDYGTLPSSILTLTPKFWHLCFLELFVLEAKWVKKKWITWLQPSTVIFPPNPQEKPTKGL